MRIVSYTAVSSSINSLAEYSNHQKCQLGIEVAPLFAKLEAEDKADTQQNVVDFFYWLFVNLCRVAPIAIVTTESRKSRKSHLFIVTSQGTEDLHLRLSQFRSTTGARRCPPP
jgi:hypothetical protein